MKPKTWARVPNRNLVNHALKLSDIRGWSLLSEDPVSMIAIHIPEEDRYNAALKQIWHTKINHSYEVKHTFFKTAKHLKTPMTSNCKPVLYLMMY